MNYMLSKALDNNGVLKKDYDMMKKRELLDNAIFHAVWTKLQSVDWNIYENEFSGTVSKIEALESMIKEEYTTTKANPDLKTQVSNLAESKTKKKTRMVEASQILLLQPTNPVRSVVKTTKGKLLWQHQ